MQQTFFADGWAEEIAVPPVQPPVAVPARRFPAAVEAAIWRADQLGAPVVSTVETGWATLDAELPGGGWGCHALTEVLAAQHSTCEWRLLTPALRPIVAAGKHIVIVGPPKRPHLPGLVQAGIDERHLVWIDVDTPADGLWATEQLIKANSAGALLSWIPHVRQEQIRRLQVAAQCSEGPVFLMRPENARHEASAAPLRVLASLDIDWALRVHVLKRRGPVHAGHVLLPSMPAGIENVLTPRLRAPSKILLEREAPRVVGGAPVTGIRRRTASVS